MTEDAGRTGTGTPRPGARRPGPVLRTVTALALLVGGGTAVTIGLSAQGATPVPPALSAATAPATTPAEPSTDPSDEPAPVALPVSVSVPAIDVASDLLHLGLNPDGTLQVPEDPDFDTAAWFEGSPRPGETGPAVIEGHVSSIGRGPSVFFNLALLEVGDTVEVTREDGTVATFEVYDLQQFPKDSFPTVQVYGNTDGPELRLITCGGTIAESTGRFADNVVVFAREV